MTEKYSENVVLEQPATCGDCLSFAGVKRVGPGICGEGVRVDVVTGRIQMIEGTDPRPDCCGVGTSRTTFIGANYVIRQSGG